MKVSKLPKDPGPAAWNAILGEQGQAAVLEEKITADWLVIGAGFAGLSAARRLSQLRPEDRIVVLDATRVAEGPAGRNSGFMIDLPHDLASDDYGGALDADQAQTRANRAAIEFAGEMATEFGLSEEAFARSGKVNAAATGKGHKHNLDYSKHLTSMGEAHEMLDADAMREMTGIPYYRSGLYTPGSVMLQPALYMRSVAKGLASNRVVIFENSPVLRLENSGDWTAGTPKGSVTAPKVILAVNGHVNSFGFFPRRLMHVFTYASMTRAMTVDEVNILGGSRTWGVTPADPMGSTIRRISGTGGDRIVVRNRFTFDPEMEVSEARITAVAKDHDQAFARRFPMLDGLDMEYRWGGRLCLSRNNVPAFGEVAEGVYSACCQNGLGTAKGTLAGMLAAELACGRQSDLLEEFRAQDAPLKLPPAPVAKIGARAVMRLGEWRAGREL